MTNYICRNVISFSPISETNGIPFFPDGISTTAIGELQAPDTYSNAKAQCESQGKHLLTVKDKKKQDGITAMNTGRSVQMRFYGKPKHALQKLLEYIT